MVITAIIKLFTYLKISLNCTELLRFDLSISRKDKNISYATGKYNFDNRGQRSIAQVYISLKKIGNNWNITQFTIN